MKHVMRLQKEPFESIESGEKTFELRLYDEKRQAIRVGDELEFILANDPSRTLRCEVIALHRFDSFEALYRALPLLRCGYTKKTLAKASPADMEKYYSVQQQKKYGVLGIELRLQ